MAGTRPTDPTSAFPSSQQCRADVKAIAHAVLAGKAGTHAIAAVIIELAVQESLPRGSACISAGRFGSQELLDLIESLSIDNGGVLSRKPFVLVIGLATRPRVQAHSEQWRQTLARLDAGEASREIPRTFNVAHTTIVRLGRGRRAALPERRALAIKRDGAPSTDMCRAL